MTESDLNALDAVATESEWVSSRVVKMLIADLRWHLEKAKSAPAADVESIVREVAKSYEPTCEACPRGVADAIVARLPLADAPPKDGGGE